MQAVICTYPTTRLAGPAGIAVDGAGNLYVAVPADNRVMIFAATAISGAPAKDVLGQLDFSSNQPNPSSAPFASARSFAGVVDIKLGPDGALYAADTGNNRVIYFPPNEKTAT